MILSGWYDYKDKGGVAICYVDYKQQKHDRKGVVMEGEMKNFVQSTFFEAGVPPIMQRRQRERVDRQIGDSMDGFEFVIEKGIPVAHRKWGGKDTKYPFRKMAIGDSFAYPKKFQGRLAASATYYGKITKKRFTIRKNGNGTCRCWRVK